VRRTTATSRTHFSRRYGGPSCSPSPCACGDQTHIPSNTRIVLSKWPTSVGVPQTAASVPYRKSAGSGQWRMFPITEASRSTHSGGTMLYAAYRWIRCCGCGFHDHALIIYDCVSVAGLYVVLGRHLVERYANFRQYTPTHTSSWKRNDGWCRCMKNSQNRPLSSTAKICAHRAEFRRRARPPASKSLFMSAPISFGCGAPERITPSTADCLVLHC
jgi:hypothetical protein